MEAKSVGLTRAEFVKTLVLTIMNYKKDSNQKEFMTMTAGELKQKIMPLPNELPVTVHDLNTGWDYRLTDFFIKGIYGEFGVRKMDPVHSDWDYKDLLDNYYRASKALIKMDKNETEELISYVEVIETPEETEEVTETEVAEETQEEVVNA